MRLFALIISLVLPAVSAFAIPECDLPSVSSADSVEVFALDGGTIPLRKDQGGSFPIHPYAQDDYHVERGGAHILAKLRVDQSRSREIVTLWEKQTFDNMKQMMCHLPAYGLRFYKDKQMLFETSICWACNNFYAPTSAGSYIWCGFDSTTPEASRLLTVLREYVPNSWIDEQQKKVVTDG